MTDDDLLQQLADYADAFGNEALAARAICHGDADLHGTFIVAIGLNPFAIALLVDGTTLAERDGDAIVGPLAAAVAERGLAKLSPSARRKAGTLLQNGRASLTLMIPLGQHEPSIHGLWTLTGAETSPLELFALRGVDPPTVVH